MPSGSVKRVGRQRVGELTPKMRAFCEALSNDTIDRTPRSFSREHPDFSECTYHGWRKKLAFRAAVDEAIARRNARIATGETVRKDPIARPPLWLAKEEDPDGRLAQWLQEYELTGERETSAARLGLRWLDIKKQLEKKGTFAHHYRAILMGRLIAIEDEQWKRARKSQAAARDVLKGYSPEIFGDRVKHTHEHTIRLEEVAERREQWAAKVVSGDPKAITAGEKVS